MGIESVRKYFDIEDPRYINKLESERFLRQDLCTDSQLPLRMLCGRVDRLDKESLSDKTVLTVVDYKTSTAPSKPHLIDQAFQQLAMYAVLLVRDDDYSPDVVKGRLLYLG